MDPNAHDGDNFNENGDSGESSTPNWWIDDNTPGTGERPEWLPEKFKKVSDIAKSYTDLEKRLGQAPSEYDTSKAEKWFDPNHDKIKGALEMAKQKHVPQDVVDNMFEAVSSYIDEQSGDFEAEKQKLGSDADERIETLDNWARSNLSEEAYNAMKLTMDSADSIKALEEIRGKIMSNEPNIPNSNESDSNTADTYQALQAELSENLDKYKSDPSYRRDLKNRLSKVVSESGYYDKEV